MLPVELHIRPAGPDDAEVMVAIYVESWNKGFGTRMPGIDVSRSRVLRWRRDLGDSTPTRWWVAARAGEDIGFVGIGPSRDPLDPMMGELDTIAVHPRKWHSGVGKQLMNAALQGLRCAGYQRAVLWTLNGYPLGERFYVATGWHRTEFTRNDGEQIRYDFDLLAR